MSNEKVIRAFLNGYQAQTPLRDINGGYYGSYRGRTLYTKDNKLVNYNTNMARLEEGVVYINKSKYSVTTSKIQTMIKSLASQYGLQVVEVEPQEV